MSDFESRVYDYLDDRLQTLTDLESLDELLDNVKTQQSLLRKQVLDVDPNLELHLLTPN